MPLCTFSMHTDILQLSYGQWQLQCCPGLLQITVPPECAPLQPSQSNLNKYKNPKMLMFPGFANFIDEWGQCDFCFTNFRVILEYLESSIRLSSTWSWHVYTIVRDRRSSCGGPLTWKAQIHDGGY